MRDMLRVLMCVGVCSLGGAAWAQAADEGLPSQPVDVDQAESIAVTEDEEKNTGARKAEGDKPGGASEERSDEPVADDAEKPESRRAGMIAVPSNTNRGGVPLWLIRDRQKAELDRQQARARLVRAEAELTEELADGVDRPRVLIRGGFARFDFDRVYGRRVVTAHRRSVDHDDRAHGKRGKRVVREPVFDHPVVEVGRRTQLEASRAALPDLSSFPGGTLRRSDAGGRRGPGTTAREATRSE